MSSGTFLFVVCALACVLGALTTVAARNPVRGAVGLLAVIIGIAGLFLKLAAEFLAAIQLIVYAGAVVVLFVFVLMLLGSDINAMSTESRARAPKLIGGGLAVFSAFAMLGMVVSATPSPPTRLGLPPPGHGSVEAVGGLIFNEGLVPFELATVLLIVAVVGAIAVARGKQGIKRSRAPVDNPQKLFGGPVHPRDAERPIQEAKPRTSEASEGRGGAERPLSMERSP
jgi:NADH-quinone oxidoreductase subunit J